MKAIGERPTPPTGRKFTKITVRDEEAIDAEVDAIVDRSRALLEQLGDTSMADNPDTVQSIKQELVDLQRRRVEVQSTTRDLWFVKSLKPRALALYAWVRDQQAGLRNLLEEDLRTQPTLEEWVTFVVIPRAALVGLLWHPYEHELETPLPVADHHTGAFDFGAYGTAIIEELGEASSGGLDYNEINALGTTLYNRAASTFVGMHDAQETANFLGVRRAPLSGPPSESGSSSETPAPS